MGFFDRWRTRQNMVDMVQPKQKMTPAVGIGGAKDDEVITMTFNDRNITFSGS